MNGASPAPESIPTSPEVITVTFNKVNGSMGLSIIAAKGEGQDHRGTYIKSVVPGGAAALVCNFQLCQISGFIRQHTVMCDHYF